MVPLIFVLCPIKLILFSNLSHNGVISEVHFTVCQNLLNFHLYLFGYDLLLHSVSEDYRRILLANIVALPAKLSWVVDAKEISANVLKTQD